MKTRIQFYEVSIFDFQPFIGMEVDVSEEEIAAYQQAVNTLDGLHSLLAKKMTPQADDVDTQIEAYRNRKGLRLLTGGVPE